MIAYWQNVYLITSSNEAIQVKTKFKKYNYKFIIELKIKLLKRRF